MSALAHEQAVPLRCGHCPPKAWQGADFEGARLGDVLPGYFARRYEVLVEPAQGPFVIRVQCRRCGNILTIRERTAKLA